MHLNIDINNCSAGCILTRNLVKKTYDPVLLLQHVLINHQFCERYEAYRL